MKNFSFLFVLMWVVACGGVKETTVNRIEPEPLNIQKSDSCGELEIDSRSFSNVRNLNVQITSKGRPLVVNIVPDGKSPRSGFNNPAGHNLEIRILRNNSEIALWQTGVSGVQGSAIGFPANLVVIDDGAPAGTHQYQVQVSSPNGAKGLFMGLRLVVYEL